MRTLLIEDEPAASKRLLKIIGEVAPQLEVAAVTDSIESSVAYLRENDMPELIISDVHLADGHCFEIFNEIHPSCPVIFTTAYDQYAIQAFRYNSIDYLLKPINKKEFRASIDKLENLRRDSLAHELNYARLAELLSEKPGGFQKRIVIRYGEKIKAVDISSVAYFYTEEKVNFLVTFDNSRFPVDYSLDELDHILDPAVFFRINRQFIVNYDAIDNMVAYSKSRVKLDLKPESRIETVVSTERSPVFKKWLLGNS
jgi:two-component system LytT family response regulator